MKLGENASVRDSNWEASPDETEAERKRVGWDGARGGVRWGGEGGGARRLEGAASISRGKAAEQIRSGWSGSVGGVPSCAAERGFGCFRKSILHGRARGRDRAILLSLALEGRMPSGSMFSFANIHPGNIPGVSPYPAPLHLPSENLRNVQELLKRIAWAPMDSGWNIH